MGRSDRRLRWSGQVASWNPGVSVSFRPSVVTATLLALALSGCSTGAVARVGTVAPSSASSTSSAPAAADVVRPVVARAGLPAGVDWTPLPTMSRGEPAAYQGHPDAMTWLLWMDPTRLRFRFIPGWKWPEGSPVRAVDRRPSTWVPNMVAAFNGGFKLSDHVGGYFYAGRTVVPLRTGLASLVVGMNGSMRVVVWGRDLHSTRGLLVVRQNLPPLVDHGRSMTRSTDGVTTWGLPYHDIPRTNRSALGQLPDGSLVYVYLHDATAPELAAAVVRLGAVTGIALDMNTGWPAALVFQHTGGQVVGTRLSPVMHQHLDAYYSRPEKDFIAVEARS